VSDNLPAPVEDAADIVKFSSGVFAVAIAALYPEMAVLAGMSQVAVGLAADRYLKKPQAIIAAELRAGNISVLTDEQQAAFVPMAFRYFEAARQGEYEHNLELLAAYITGELQKEIPDAGGVARLARRVEGLTKPELKIIATINSHKTGTIYFPGANSGPTASYMHSSQSLHPFFENDREMTPYIIKSCLTDLNSRGLLIADGMTRYNKSEEYYYISAAFTDLVQSAASKFSIARDDDAKS
jgi:hypothetical protein